MIVGLHGPLTPDNSGTNLDELWEYGLSVPVIFVDELVVRRNLPSATNQVLEGLL